ncbi:MAG: D-alanyl-D-alanine carboxypeptidase family protein [Saccharofermentanales bacterium]
MPLKRLSLLLILVLIILLPPARLVAAGQPLQPPRPEAQNWPSVDQIEGRQWVVLEGASGEMILDHRGDEQAWPASVTKIMTALLVIEAGDLERMVTVSAAAVNLPAGSSKVGLLAGEEVRVYDLLCALMVASGNDAANALAEHLGGDLPGFAQMMNDRALQLGLTGTHFTNPSGLHEQQHYSTARDMAVLTAYAMENELFREIFGLARYSMPITNLHPYTGWAMLNSTNRFMSFGETTLRSKWIANYLGGKTGTTAQAGNNLVLAAETQSGHELIAVLFGVPPRSVGNTSIFIRTLLETAAARLPEPTAAATAQPTDVPEKPPTETTFLRPTESESNSPGPVESPGGTGYFRPTVFFILAGVGLAIFVLAVLYIRKLRRS